MSETIYLEKSQVPAWLRAGYMGNKFRVEVCESVTIPSYAGRWDGGTREQYCACRLSDGATVAMPGQDSAPWDKSRDNVVPIQPSFCVVRHSSIAGKDTGLTFYVHPQNAAALLPAPAAELSDLEKVVLAYTRCRKASYAGKDRFAQALEDWQWKARGKTDRPFYSRTEWENAKLALASRGLLNKAGAITPAGKNASASLRDGF